MHRPHLTPACLALLLCAALVAACDGSSGATTKAGRTGEPAAAIGASGLYIALGDSLSAGIGASDADRGFVGLVHTNLGSKFQLLNLGVPGHTSQDLIDSGKLDQAIQEIERRRGDTDPDNDASLLTLEIGGNDLLRLYFGLVQTGLCPDLETALQEAQCIDALRSALDGFRPNLMTALDRIRLADPSLRIMLLTLYNPFGYVPNLAELGDLSLEGKADTPFPEGLNDIIRRVALERNDVTVVDVFPLFQGRTPELIAGDQIHPNDAGYQVMADAVLAAIAQLEVAR